MCAVCGCGESGHEHPHGHDHDHDHDHTSHEATRLRLEKRILTRNDEQAALNRRWLSTRQVLALNLLSSPGAGKTTLLERTIRDLGEELPVAVIEGDQESELDAARIRETGCPAVQLNTGQGCHLDARMVHRGLHELASSRHALLLIENVGNLVCPALFDLGEHAKVVVASVTEGDDKPLKYPYVFRASQLVLLNKIDLLPYVSFDTDRFLDSARRVNPELQVLPVCATRGDGLEDWYHWLREQARHARE